MFNSIFKIMKFLNTDAYSSSLKIGILVCSFLLSSILLQAQTVNTTFATQMNTLFYLLDKNKIPEGILLDYGMEFTNLPAYNGTLTDSTYTNTSRLKELYHTLLSSRMRSNVNTGFISPDTLNNRLFNNRLEGVITLGGLFFKYNRFKSDALENNKITYTGGKFYDKYISGVWQNPYETLQTFAMAPSISRYQHISFNVKVPSNTFLSNYSNEISTIQIDFDNGNGYTTMVLDQNTAVSYTSDGVKTWKYKLTLSSGTVLYNQSKIEIINNIIGEGDDGLKDEAVNKGASTSLNIPETITATKAHLGAYGVARLEIDFAKNDSLIRNPLIVAEGFDIGHILYPEDIYGQRSLKYFMNSVFYGGDDLRSLVWNPNKEYDIIYVNWEDGTDYLQRNAYSLEEVIKWVNDNKEINATQNVVLGQSMGGVIARYALADMEENSLDHDTRLFISHDAPQQGANVPLSLQFAFRNINNQFIQAGNTLLGSFITIPIVNNNLPTQLLSLLDKPATKQLLANRSNNSYQLSNNEHTLFFDELKNSNGTSGSGGYPTTTRNIALSNGSECGKAQDFVPGNNLLSYQSTEGISALESVLVPFAGLFGGMLVDYDLYGVTLLGLIPGSSKYTIDLQAHALFETSGNQIYKCQITYHKKIFFIINSSTNIINVQKNQPSGVLPFDSYGGGYYSTRGFFETISMPELYIRDKFNFIPTASALDIGKRNVELVDSDYKKSYVGANPPTGSKSSPFDNFSTEFDSENPNAGNYEHISFNERNGDWLAAELNATNIIYTNCSFVCDDIEIEGSEFLCNSEIYNVDATASNFTWSITEGSHLVTMSGNGTSSITLNQVGSSSGQVKISVELSSDGYDCGDIDIDPIAIWVGLPKAYTQGFEPVICSGVLPDEDIYSLPISPGAETYELTSNSPFLTVAGGFVNPGEGVFMMATQPGNYTMTLTTTNDCGSKQSTIFVTAENCGGPGGPGGLFSIYPNPATSELTIESSEEVESQNDILNKSSALKAKAKDLELSELYSYEIYDQFSALKQKGEFRELIKVNLTTLKKGLYLIKIKSKSYSEVYKFVIQ